MSTTLIDIDQKTINVLKGLIMDMVRKANSGHTGGPFSSLNFVYVLYKDFLKFDPKNPEWIDRDRFIMSCGHESALLYSILALIGWLQIDDLKLFCKTYKFNYKTVLSYKSRIILYLSNS